jgi:hypothetical protein
MLVGYHCDGDGDEGVGSEMSTDYKGSVSSRQSLRCNQSMDHGDFYDLGLDFGFENGGEWSSQPAGIVAWGGSGQTYTN